MKVEIIHHAGAHGRASLHSLNIPATLQDSLMARLDWLETAKGVAQLIITTKDKHMDAWTSKTFLI